MYFIRPFVIYNKIGKQLHLFNKRLIISKNYNRPLERNWPLELYV